MKFTWMMITTLAFSSTLAFAGHPASDRVVDALEEGFRIAQMSGNAQTRAMCQFVNRYVERGVIANRLLGNYVRSDDTAGVQAFRREAGSFMVTKALPKIKDLKGSSGSYSVGQSPSQRSDGSYSVPVTIKTNGKTYSGRAIVSKDIMIVDVEYLGFSGVNYVGRDVKKELDQFAKTSKKPVSAFVSNLRSQKDYVSCR